MHPRALALLAREGIDAAFESACRVLRARIEVFLTLPADLRTRDPVAFGAALERIGEIAA